MGDGEEPPLLSRSEALSLSSGTGNRNRAGKRNKAAGPRWRHACHVLLYAPLPTGSPQPPFAILESLEAGLSRELREELGPAAAGIELRPCHHRGAKAWTGSGRKKSGSDVGRLSSEDQVGAEAQPGSGRKEQSGSDVGVVTHFYIRRVSLEELGEIERGEKEAPEHGLEVQGLIRVPLGGGLPTFLQQGFIGDARAQLLGALHDMGWDPPQDMGSRNPPHDMGLSDPPP
ncbi:U8 snoRNA-decapping enzyme-like isoform X2 [Coturnix japonica]|uniref:U8 snoRNA-decapping enzyme-like isoform X2 n=1 Tax=Coturnix japonica TaxID=93934 RepID=UPI000777320F|nr:U8 snoRNA-decapping enzyme-like isoform X2 [Coturnix japonica]